MAISSPDHFSAGHSENKANLYSAFWRSFHERFSNEEACQEEILERIFKARFKKCLRCDGKKVERKAAARIVRCRKCNKVSSLTANTILHNIRKFMPFLAAIELADQGLPLTGSNIWKETGITQSTNWNLTHRISFVLNRAMDAQEDTSIVPSSAFINVFLKRSLETPANRRPAAEQEKMEQNSGSISQDILKSGPQSKQTPSQTQDQRSATTSQTSPTPSTQALAAEVTPRVLSEMEQKIFCCISEVPVQIGTICEETGLPPALVTIAVTMMELDGLIENVDIGWYVIGRAPSKKKTSSKISATNEDFGLIIGNCDVQTSGVVQFSEFIKENSHGIARRYLQLYLARYWLHNNKTRWQPGELIKECSKPSKVHLKEIRSFVSPLIVTVANCEHDESRADAHPGECSD